MPISSAQRLALWSWLLVIVGCGAFDLARGVWLALPVFVVAVYTGMMLMKLITYPMLDRWQAWLRPHGVGRWYAIELAVWLVATAIVVGTASLWLDWRWNPAVPLRWIGGAIGLVAAVGGAWTAAEMGVAILVFGSAVVPNSAPQRLITTGPFAYVRAPSYLADALLLAGVALLTGLWLVAIAWAVYSVQAFIHEPLEERDVATRFGSEYTRYRTNVRRFLPRLTPYR